MPKPVGLLACIVAATLVGWMGPASAADGDDAAMDGAAGKFELQVWDARTGRKSVIDGTLDPAAASPPVNETAATTPAQQ